MRRNLWELYNSGVIRCSLLTTYKKRSKQAIAFRGALWSGVKGFGTSWADGDVQHSDPALQKYSLNSLRKYAVNASG